jgi:hypothetical protein
MRKLVTIALPAAPIATLTACGGMKHAAKLPPKPCRITSSRATCQAYLAKGVIKREGTSGDMDVLVLPGSCPDRKYPALCNKP